jgi:NAD-dependent dihydropyrimidine dehydrogenase PreA subunit
VIELVLAQRCIECDKCVRVCPTDVFDAVPGEPPVIARQSDCQTCFLCELYCPVDALYVDPDFRGPVPVDEAEILATDWPAQYRRDSGWGRARRTHPNESWRMGDIFAAARFGGGRLEVAGPPKERTMSDGPGEHQEPVVPDIPVDYTDSGVPTFDYVRDRIENRVATAEGAKELAGEPTSIDEQIADRDRAGREKLEQIRRSLRGE